MANDKSGRKKQISPLVAIIILAIMAVGSFLGIDLTELIPNEITTITTLETTDNVQDVEGQLVVEHDGENIKSICYKDEMEKARRLELLRESSEDWSGD